MSCQYTDSPVPLRKDKKFSTKASFCPNSLPQPGFLIFIMELPCLLAHPWWNCPESGGWTSPRLDPSWLHKPFSLLPFCQDLGASVIFTHTFFHSPQPQRVSQTLDGVALDPPSPQTPCYVSLRFCARICVCLEIKAMMVVTSPGMLALRREIDHW